MEKISIFESPIGGNAIPLQYGLHVKISSGAVTIYGHQLGICRESAIPCKEQCLAPMADCPYEIPISRATFASTAVVPS